MSMTGAELLAEMKRKLGNTNFGQDNDDLYIYLNESKKWHERNTNISLKSNVGIINTADEETITLDSSTIDLDADAQDTSFSLIKIIDDTLFYDENWNGIDNPPFIEKTTTRHIQLLRNTSEQSDEPYYYSIRRVDKVLTLELYPKVSVANSVFATSKLRCNIKQMTPAVNSAYASYEVEVQDYAYDAITFKAARDLMLVFNDPRWKAQLGLWKEQLRMVNDIANQESSGSVHQQLAQ